MERGAGLWREGRGCGERGGAVERGSGLWREGRGCGEMG